MLYSTLKFSLLASTAAATSTASLSLLSRASSDPSKFIDELIESELVVLAREMKTSKRSPKHQHDDTLPLVFLHGMGDSCFNNGMNSITEESGQYLNVYSVCIPTGDTRLEDTMNGFFMSMDANVDTFAAKVRADDKLAGGFNCVGLSQGNNVCRGYIQKYNDPPVNTHLSIHGPVAGVAALPHCYPDGSKGTLCQEVSDLLAKLAYNQPMQDFLFQAGYFRDVNFIDTDEYKSYSEIGQWNNEGNEVNNNIKSNFLKTNKYAMIKANGDTVVVPREGEWWGSYDSDFVTILTMKETEWYKQDKFGLKTADEMGKLFFNSTEGNHLDFTDEELYGWLDLYM